MGKTLTEIAKQLQDADKKVQLIYAFNGSGKTRLSRKFKQLIAPKNVDSDGEEQTELTRNKILYYNAFTEDLFYWDNDLEMDAKPKLKIQPNSYTTWLIKILKDLGQDQNIIKNFQRVNNRVTPSFNEEYKYFDEKKVEITVPAFSEVTFSTPNTLPLEIPFIVGERIENIKISKGEESNFIWSIFYTLLEQVIEILNQPEIGNRETNEFDQLEYVFIDDPVSSLDENHLIELAVNLASLIKASKSELKFVITTHSPLFYNVLFNEFNSDDKNFGWKAKNFEKYRLEKKEDGLSQLEVQPNDSPFSYHLFLLSEIKSAIEANNLKKYHFNFLRNILEKTSTFLGYKKWSEILPKTNDGTSDAYIARIINISSHSKQSGDEVSNITDEDKRVLKYLVNELINNYRFWKQEEQKNDRTN